MNCGVIYLSRNGDSFNCGNKPTGKKEFDSCKTHLEVLRVLKKIEEDQSYFNNLYHTHNYRYPSHTVNVDHGLTYGRAHECPPKKMIDFVKLRMRIFDYHTISDINECLNEAPPEITVSFWGQRILNFKEYSITLETLIAMITKVAQKTAFGIDEKKQEDRQELIRKITSYWKTSSEKCGQRSYFTQALEWGFTNSRRLDAMVKELSNEYNL